MKQNDAILAHLQTGQTITPMLAYELFGVLACHSRISELRKRQAPVVTKARKEVEEWAKKTGAFTEFDSKVKDARKITRYKGEADEGR